MPLRKPIVRTLEKEASALEDSAEVFALEVLVSWH